MTQTLQSQGVATATPNESFYLNRFKECIVKQGWYNNGRIVEQDFYCELYKGFAIVTWKREFSTPQGVTTTKYESFVWEIGGFLDKLQSLSWISQGCATTGYGADTYEKALKKIHKRLDVLSLMYSIKDELRALSNTFCKRINYDDSHVFNAGIGDVVAIRAFGRSRLGKVVSTTGSRFIVAYMTPSNSDDVHYKTLPLTHLYPKEVTP